MTILLTNDDGVYSDGLKALADALRPLGDITIVAPLQEASAIGHALTLRRPLRLETLNPNTFGVDGTPTDCVNIAVTTVLRRLPDLIVSGINKGWNLGDDVTYSGTVSGALEGALLGVPSIAVSLERSRHAATRLGFAQDRHCERSMPPVKYSRVWSHSRTVEDDRRYHSIGVPSGR